MESNLSESAPNYINGTIIIVAVYINNEEHNYNELIKCLRQLRNIYNDTTIITVDNASLNTKWYETATELNMIILQNNSVLHRFEVGAYKRALQEYRADKYILIQGTIFIHNRFDLSSLDIDKPNIIALHTIKNNSFWESGINFINSLLGSVNLKPWTDNQLIVVWNCFCCNNLYINEMIKDKVFLIPSNTKNHSCAFERIFGCYAASKLNTLDIETINENLYQKIALWQFDRNEIL